MKSTRRHELQHNVLDAELAKTVEFFRKYGWKIFYAVVAVVVICLAIYWYVSNRSRQKAQIEDQYTQLKTRQNEGIEQPDLLIGRFKELIGQQRAVRIAAMACIDVADIYAMQMLRARDSTERDGFAAQAQEYYRKAIADFPDQKLAAAKAHIGLAKLAEGRREFQKAREAYQAVLAIPGLAGQPIKSIAEVGLKLLGKLQEPVAMATTAPAEEQPAGQPASRPAAAAAAAPSASRPADKVPPVTQPAVSPNP